MAVVAVEQLLGIDCDEQAELFRNKGELIVCGQCTSIFINVRLCHYNIYCLSDLSGQQQSMRMNAYMRRDIRAGGQRTRSSREWRRRWLPILCPVGGHDKACVLMHHSL